MALQPTDKRIEQIRQQVRDEAAAKRSIAGRLYPTKAEKQGPVHGWGKASESLHRARGATSPLGGQAKK